MLQRTRTDTPAARHMSRVYVHGGPNRLTIENDRTFVRDKGYVYEFLDLQSKDINLSKF